MNHLAFERRKKTDPHLNMTPLIDMVFLLLIFFVLSSHFVYQKGFKVKLPKAVHAQMQDNDQITVLIDKNVEVFLNDRKVPLKSLASAIKIEFGKSKSKTVIVKADEDVPLGIAVEVMDIAKEADADGLVISTQIENGKNN